MFIALKAITEFGQPVFCVNPAKFTVDIDQAFKWETKEEAQRVLQESKEVYGLQATVVEIIKAKQAFEKKAELKAV